MKNIEKLLDLLEKGTSQFHVVEAVAQQLREANYKELFLGDMWELKKGGKYYLAHHGSSIFAFTIGDDFKGSDGFRIAAAHGDFPGFRIKPNPEIVTEKYVKLNVESYGGVNISSWLDRPLSIAGRVILRSDDVFYPQVRLVDFKRPIITIPNIAIHQQRDMNKGIELNKQTQILPILATVENEEDAKDYFLRMLANELEVDKDEILEYELNVYNTDVGEIIGASEEFISAPRLDNLTSVQAILTGLCDEESEDRVSGINMIAVFDHEEIGSKTKQGAGSMLLGTILQKLYLSLGLSDMDYKSAIADSLLMSVDVSHGVHPNYTEKNDLTNKDVLNKGFSIKEASAQSYATDSEAIAIVQQICDERRIDYQKFVNRSDMVGGGTLGSIASAMLPVRTVDIGTPLLAMHSAREIMGLHDQNSIVDFIKAYFSI